MSKLFILGGVLIALVVMNSLSNAVVHADEPNGFTTPPEGAVVSGGVWVDGVANHSSFLKWQLYILFGGDEKNAALIEESDQPNPEPGVFTKLDTTSLPDGMHRLRLRVVKKDGNYEEFFRVITIDNSAAAFVNGITKPLDGEIVFGIVSIKGFADDPNFESWDLDLLVDGDDRRPLQLKRDPIPNRTGDTFTRIDTTTLPDGQHRIRLRVTRLDGNYTEFFRTITINNKITATPAPPPRGTRTPRPPTPVALGMQNQISSPVNGATVSALVPVTGYADVENFESWQLDLLFNTDPERVNLLAFGKKRNKGGEPFTLLDTTALPNGMHSLRLRVIRVDGTYNEYSSAINVANSQAVASSEATTAPVIQVCDEASETSSFANTLLTRFLGLIVRSIRGLCGMNGQT